MQKEAGGIAYGFADMLPCIRASAILQYCMLAHTNFVMLLCDPDKLLPVEFALMSPSCSRITSLH